MYRKNSTVIIVRHLFKPFMQGAKFLHDLGRGAKNLHDLVGGAKILHDLGLGC